MEFIEVLTNRRSVRKFSNRRVSQDLIKNIISLAVCAPSACNRQEWRFIVIEKEEIKKKIFDFGGSEVITDAPVVILVLYSNQTNNLEYSDHIQSAAAAIQNLLLAAYNYNLAGCWICHLPSKRVLRKFFNIPKIFDPVAAIALGYPSIVPVKIPRKYKPEQVISYDKFDFPETKEVESDSNLILRQILSYIYKHSPLFIKKRFLNKFINKNLVKKFDN